MKFWCFIFKHCTADVHKQMGSEKNRKDLFMYILYLSYIVLDNRFAIEFLFYPSNQSLKEVYRTHHMVALLHKFPFIFR